MAREVWPQESVIEASNEVVCLAVHRYEQEQSALGDLWPSGFMATDWAVRLGVLGYPQMRFLDGWARPLAGMEAHVYARSVEEVVEAVQATARVAKRFEEPAERALPEELGELAPRRLRERLAGPDPGRRAEAWGHVLSRGKLRSDDLLAIFEWERDGLVRLGVLWSLRDRRIKSDEDAARILALAVDGDNDHVRSEAIALSVGLRPEAAAEILKEVMRIVLDGCAWSNPNNMLVAATQAAVEVASPDLLEPLGRVLASTETNNSAHHYARDALRKIGKQPRMRKAVEEILARHGYD